MPKKTWAGMVVLLAVLVAALHFIVVEAVGTAALDSIVEHGLGLLGLEKSRVSALLVPYVIPGMIAALCLFAAFKLGEYERTSFEPKADLDPRLAFDVIRNNKNWLRQNTEGDPEKRSHLVQNYLELRLDRQMHDALVQGRLWAWGQKNLSDFEEGPFDRIAAAEWHDVEVFFVPAFAPGARTLAKTRVRKVTAYVGIRFNIKQMAKEFKISKREFR